MSVVFKNEKQLEEFLLAKCRDALFKAQGEVYRIIKRFLDQFYKEYDPVMYERTNQFLNSLVRSRVVPDGKGYKAEVYFDLDYIYRTGSYPTGEQVMQAAEYGRHGAMGLAVADFKGTSVWHESLAVLDASAIKILIDMLKPEGIPIK